MSRPILYCVLCGMPYSHPEVHIRMCEEIRAGSPEWSAVEDTDDDQT